MAKSSKLSQEDLDRVQEYLSSPVHSVERQPYRPLRLLLVLWIVVSVLGGLAYLAAWLKGVV
ncbi:MAG: DUF3094 family protein [Porticoccaceae bacterium]